MSVVHEPKKRPSSLPQQNLRTNWQLSSYIIYKDWATLSMVLLQSAPLVYSFLFSFFLLERLFIFWKSSLAISHNLYLRHVTQMKGGGVQIQK